jgi:hypothetical protein
VDAPRNACWDPPVFTIEQNEPIASTCNCCGGTTTSLTRYVYKDGNARAVYYARFSNNHPDGLVSMLVSIGAWGDGTTPADRVSFAMDLRDDGGQLGVGITDAGDSPWNEAKILGRMLDREAALEHPLVQEVLQIVDHALVEDGPLREFFERRASWPPS